MTVTVTVKVLSAVAAVWWTIMFVLYVIGAYEPSRLMVGVVLFFAAAYLTTIAIGINRKEDAE
ncbi:hypothetical protein [Paenibacillus chibensis]|uniref:hypothetical protein n=1 Tax=Paenibacillus chibensis TaxID=59846 RepID=UPI000FDA60DB|nr:hypothetical protein [Paenibacillus chibensis]MEC0370016.1 hypothetical protein [Paenibacillus chibensis]